jgi:hypothetical protein
MIANANGGFGITVTCGVICYDSLTSTWNVIGDQNGGKLLITPGILLFKGNLKIKGGKIVNTILATGDVDATTSNLDLYASNYASFAETCQNTSFPGLVPTNLCDTSTLIYPTIANVGFMAGSYVGTTFNGGIIKLSSSTKVSGAVVAGAVLKTSGGAYINGAVLAANQRGNESSVLTNITINLTAVSFPGSGKYYNPLSYPAPVVTNTFKSSSNMLWVQYK